MIDTVISSGVVFVSHTLPVWERRLPELIYAKLLKIRTSTTSVSLLPDLEIEEKWVAEPGDECLGDWVEETLKKEKI
jgi:hypothetical protein